jgi:hypothetical protein
VLLHFENTVREAILMRQPENGALSFGQNPFPGGNQVGHEPPSRWMKQMPSSRRMKTV